MVQAIKQRVRIGAGGTIKVYDPALIEGTEVEVIVLVHETAPHPASEDLLSLASMFGAAKGVFQTPEEVDQHLRDLRDEWD